MVTTEFESPAQEQYATVTAVRKLPGLHKVHDVEVSNRHRFYANGFLVHNCMGTLHPHGDTSIYGALVTAVNAPCPPFKGTGNWGSMMDGAAASRYTEMMLSTYGKQFLISDYLACVPMAPNYDDKDLEPVFLPALLPSLFLNDNSGIGLAVTSGIPAFTPTSLLGVLIRMIDKEQMTPLEFAKALEFYEPWGGVTVNSKANKLQRLQLMNSDRATIQFHSPLKIEREAKRILVNDFAPNLNHDKFLDAVRKIVQVKSCHAGKGMGYVIQVHPSTNFIEFDKVCDQVQKLSETRVSYRLYVSSRKLVAEGDTPTVEVEFMTGSVPQLLLKWLKFRIALESRCIQYRIDETNKVIARLELMIYACDHLDVIFKALRTTDPAAAISKGLKITMEQAKSILELRVRQLSRLDQNVLKEKLAAMQKRLAILQKQLKRPAANVRKYFENCLELFIQRPRMEGSTCIQWWLRSNPVTDDTQTLLAAATTEESEE